MIHQIYSSQDTTLYEVSPTQNTGLDQILEIDKTIDGSTTVSRILTQFDLSEISSSIVDGVITNPKFYLVLSATEGTEIPIDYTLYAHAISGSWTMGNGRWSNNPISTQGASWEWRNDSETWKTGSYTGNNTGSYGLNEGGGNWYTGSGFIASESFNYREPDTRMDVTDIVNSWLSGTVPNDGFIIKRSTEDEYSAVELGSLKFFSDDTHTVYVPKLQIGWDAQTFTTGSLPALSNENIVVYTKGLKKHYKINSKERIRLRGRAKYPPRTFATSSANLDVNYLPQTTYWQVRDTVTNDIIIPFDNNYTKVSCDANGNYFDFWASGFQPNRYYRFEFKVVDGNYERYFGDGNHFKVVR